MKPIRAEDLRIVKVQAVISGSLGETYRVQKRVKRWFRKEIWRFMRYTDGVPSFDHRRYDNHSIEDARDLYHKILSYASQDTILKVMDP